jgi:hypothetical protein
MLLFIEISNLNIDEDVFDIFAEITQDVAAIEVVTNAASITLTPPNLTMKLCVGAEVVAIRVAVNGTVIDLADEVRVEVVIGTTCNSTSLVLDPVVA